jgi:hypothetical protein
MISASLFKLEQSGWHCDNTQCKHNPKYHFNIIGKNWVLKTDITCLIVELADFREIYCPDCIDEIYLKLKPILDRKLWLFQ